MIWIYLFQYTPVKPYSIYYSFHFIDWLRNGNDQVITGSLNSIVNTSCIVINNNSSLVYISFLVREPISSECLSFSLSLYYIYLILILQRMDNLQRVNTEQMIFAKKCFEQSPLIQMARQMIHNQLLNNGIKFSQGNRKRG